MIYSITYQGASRSNLRLRWTNDEERMFDNIESQVLQATVRRLTDPPLTGRINIVAQEHEKMHLISLLFHTISPSQSSLIDNLKTIKSSYTHLAK